MCVWLDYILLFSVLWAHFNLTASTPESQHLTLKNCILQTDQVQSAMKIDSLQVSHWFQTHGCLLL